MIKEKRKVLTLLAAAALAVSVPGNSADVQASSNTFRVNVATGYLALRNDTSFDTSNEIGELYTGDLVEVADYTGATGYWYVYSPKYDRSGDTVCVSDSSDPSYWYVYSPKLNSYGYVNKDYLYGGSSGSSTGYFGETRTVHVDKGYLALRSMKAYDSSNELGELYTGDTVQLMDTSDSQYWYVYSPKYDLNGFVNKDYLTGGTAYATKTVHVSKGYLALRNAKAYDTSNEIGQLNTGDTVQLIDSNDSQYWYVYSPRLMNYGYVNKDYLY